MSATFDPAQFVRRMRPQLGTFVEIGCATQADAQAALDAAFDAIARIERRLSFHAPDSELSRLNAARGGVVALSSSSRRVLAAAVAFTRASDGLFNCTVGGELVVRGALPDHLGGDCLPVGTADDVVFDGNGGVRLARAVRVTLDGFAKGWAVDRAIAALRARGVARGWVNAGGDLRVFGDLVLPVSRREIDGRLLQLGGLRNAALATSISGAPRDPSFPGVIVGVATHSGVWSVTARFAWRADALTKVAANAPAHARAAIVARLGGRLHVAQGNGGC